MVATVLAAIQGKFGSTEYWTTTMAVNDLVRFVQFPYETDDWEILSIEQKYQRQIDLTRITKKHGIADYFASDADRFSGALVLAVENPKGLHFQPLVAELGKTALPESHLAELQHVGFLTLPQEVSLIPLDGQHRAKALKFAKNGVDDRGQQIAGLKANSALGREQVSVILLRFDPVRARRIFSKINRYARPTNKGQNLITDDDDAMAVMTRELLGEENGVISARLVRIDANTLSAKSPEFTTIATFHEANLAIVKSLRVIEAGSLSQMPDDQREWVQEDVRQCWETLLHGIEWWDKALSDPTPSGDLDRIRIREDTLLGKPIGQSALVLGWISMRERCGGVSDDLLCARLNEINWGIKASQWENILTREGGRVLTGKDVIKNAGEYIAYLGGAPFTEEECNSLLSRIYGENWKERGHSLPAPVA